MTITTDFTFTRKEPKEQHTKGSGWMFLLQIYEFYFRSSRRTHTDHTVCYNPFTTDDGDTETDPSLLQSTHVN